MKIQYFGTSAAEGIPAMFCQCPVCMNAKLVGGRDVRTRSQMLINDELLIDFSADSYLHFLKYNIQYEAIHHLLISHTHWDHFYPEDLMMKSPMYVNQTMNSLNIYGNEKAGKLLKQKQLEDQLSTNDFFIFTKLEEYQEYRVGEYKIIPLLADHDSREKCFIFDIQHGDKRMLYGHDTGFIIQENWDFWAIEKPFYHFITLDCTNQELPSNGNHMNIGDNVIVKEKMEELGYADNDTIVCCSHFSHNGGLTYDDMSKISMKNRIITAYDGLTVCI